MNSAVDIMVVDDDAMVMALVDRALKKGKASYRCFSTADEALHYLSKNRPKIMIVDYRMPKTNGLELIESLHLDKALDTPVIYLCSSVELPDLVLQAAQKHGVIPLLKEQLMKKGFIEELCINYS